jgi:class 3 adenylate cyclase/CheY-like chemotaxis protein
MTEHALDRERQRRAGLANMRQELLAPVTALVGYGEILVEKARDLALQAIGPDLRCILLSAQDLLELVDRLLGADAMAEPQSGADLGELQAKLRHDLRNPLNAIKGYAELLLEELDEVDAAVTRPDLEALLCEADRLLSRIDVIIDFSSSKIDPALGDTARGPVTSMIANLVRTVRAIEEYPAPPHETGRILVVDDNASNRNLLFRRLSHDGHHVAGAHSGRRALEILEIEEFDLILLDLLMPDLNGFQVLGLLKADERLHDIPVIMISGLQETDAVIRCIEAGAEDYLAKPFSPVLLRARISACLERKRWRDRERRYVERIELEKQRYESLLRNILPGQIVARLNNGEVVIADRVEEATILFADLVGFTAVASRLPPAVLVDNLNRIFSAFDDLCRRLQIEKIKTIGDAYMAAAGLPLPRPDHAEVIADFALAMLDTLDAVNATIDVPFQIRIGIHTGPVVAGVIGSHRFLYDIWGDAVNLASRLESHSLPGRIHVSAQTSGMLASRYELEPRGLINLRGIGKVRTSFLIRRKSAQRGCLAREQRVEPGATLGPA